MEEVAAGQASGIRRPEKASRHRGTGRRASEEADDDAPPPPVAGEGGNHPAADVIREGDLAAEDEEEEEPDDKYLDRTWVSAMSMSIFLIWAKAQPLIHPPAWLTAAREAGAGAGKEQLHAAQMYESISVLSLVQEAYLAVYLCLYKLRMVSAGRTLESMKQLMAVGIVASATAAAYCAAGAADGDSESWREAVAAAMLPLMPAASFLMSFLLGELKEQVRELLRG